MKKGFVYSDGGARGNPGPAAIGVMVCNEKGEMLQEHAELIGDTTNNVAEYTGVIVGLELARKLGLEEIQYFGDSELVMRQMSGKYKVKTPHILALYQQAKRLEQSFHKVTYTQIPREHEKIRHVDGLVNAVLDGDR